MRFPLGPAALLALLGTFLLPFLDFSLPWQEGRDHDRFTKWAFGSKSTAELDLGKSFAMKDCRVEGRDWKSRLKTAAGGITSSLPR